MDGVGVVEMAGGTSGRIDPIVQWLVGLALITIAIAQRRVIRSNCITRRDNGLTSRFTANIGSAIIGVSMTNSRTGCRRLNDELRVALRTTFTMPDRGSRVERETESVRQSYFSSTRA